MNALKLAALHGEVLDPRAQICVIAAMHPHSAGHQMVWVPEGSSIAEVIVRCAEQEGNVRLAPAAQVTIDGVPLPREHWRTRRIVAGQNVVVRAVPGKGVGSILKSILTIALVVVASFIAGPGGALAASIGVSGAAAVGAAIVIGGNLLLGLLFPPTLTTADDETKASYSIAGTRNEVAKWGPIPCLHGTLRIAPKYAATPYTEFIGDDQYIRLLYVWGQGPIKIGPLKIGETLLSEFEDVEVQTFEGYPTDGQQTLYPSEVVQEDLSIELSQVEGPTTRSSAEDAVEIVLDLVAPNGLSDSSDKSGKPKRYTVSGTIEILSYQGTTVIESRAFSLSGKNQDVIRTSHRFVVPEGQYDVRVTKTSEDHEKSTVQGTVAWTALKSFRKSPPIEYSKPLAITAIRIRATKQLNGTPDDLNAICTSVATSWTGNAWSPNRETQNPADLFRLVLQGPGCARPVPDSKIDLATLQIWGDMCRQKGFKFNMNRDFRSSILETLRDICAAGRGVPVFRDGRYSVAWEDDLAPLVQHFTPRNSRDFSTTIAFPMRDHAMRVKFLNERKGYIEDEKLVFDDGYNKFNATLYSQQEFPGVTDPDLVYKHARYRIAEGRLRTSIYRLRTDIEHIICSRGDRVAIAHETIQRGLVSGRVTAVEGQLITVDSNITQVAGKAYSIRFRAGRTSIIRTVSLQPGTGRKVMINGSVPRVGDLFTFGYTGTVTGTYRVLAIRPSSDLTAELEFVDDAPGIQVADTGPVIGEPGTVIVAPPLDLYRPRALSISQSLVEQPTGVVQITSLFWTVKPGGPMMDRYLIVAISDEGEEIRTSVPGTQFACSFVNLSTDNWTFLVQGFTTDNRWTGFSAPLYFEQTLPDALLGIGYNQLVEQLRSEIDLITNNADGSLQQYRDSLKQLIDAVAETNINHANFEMQQREILRQTVVSVSDFATAAVLQEIEARVQGDNSLASAVTALEATSGLASASGYYKLEAIVGGAEGRARFEVFLNAGTPDSPNWAKAGQIMEVWIQDGIPMSRVIFISDQFAISMASGAAPAIPFIVQNSQVYINKAFIRDLTADNIRAGTIDADTIRIGGVDMKNLANGAVTGSAIGTGATEVNLSLTVAAGVVQVLARGVGSRGNTSSVLTLYRDGVEIMRATEPGGGTTESQDGPGRPLKGDKPMLLGFDAPPPGTYQYRLTMTANVSAGVDTRTCTLSLINLRR